MIEEDKTIKKDFVNQLADTKARIHPDLSDLGLDLYQFVSNKLENYGIRIKTGVKVSPFGSVIINSKVYAEALDRMAIRLGDSGQDFLEYCKKAHSLFPESETTHLRSSLYYRNNQEGFQNEFQANQEVFKLVDTHYDLEEAAEIGDNEYLIILSILDYTRNLGLKTRYTLGSAELSGLYVDPVTSENMANFADASAQAYYEFLLHGSITPSVLRELTNSFNSQSIPEFIRENPALLPQKPRELDHPLEIVASAMQIIDSGNFYDLAIDFPYGSIGLANAIDNISRIVTGRSIIGSVQELYMSSYRVQNTGLSTLLPQPGNQPEHSPRRILALDDNLVSGGTIIIVRKLLQELYGRETIIDAAVVELYTKGIDEWQAGNYQFLTETHLNSVLASCDDTSLREGIITRLFDPPNHLLSQLGIMPIDNMGIPVEGNYVMWKPMLKLEDFDFIDKFNHSELYNSLINLYGFQSYSAIYNETLQQLDYYPVAELKIDDLPGYIDSLS